MFTGLVAAVGRIDAVDRSADGARLRVATELAGGLAQGDSVAVNGACLTVAEVDSERFSAEAMHETLSRTSLGGDDIRVTLAGRPGGVKLSGDIRPAGCRSVTEERPKDAAAPRSSLPPALVACHRTPILPEP